MSAVGAVRIAPEVLTLIVNLTTMSVPGVVAMAEPPPGKIRGRKEPDATRGVRVRVRENVVDADIDLVVAHGAAIAPVTDDVRGAVARAIHEMLGMETREINICVRGIE